MNNPSNTFQQTLAAFFGLIDPEHRFVFENYVNRGLRPGQAFFNCLPLEMRFDLRKSVYDPYYNTDPQAVLDAIDYLTTK